MSANNTGNLTEGVAPMGDELQAGPAVCPRCGTPFTCRADDIRQCQCYGANLTPADIEKIRRAGFQGADCLCRKCLDEFISRKSEQE